MSKNQKTNSTGSAISGSIVHSYTREQALTDGTLIDLSGFEEFNKMWKPTAACTVAVWALIQSAIRDHDHDLAGILWDISCMARLAAKNSGDASTIRFDVIIGRTVCPLKMHLGPGDTLEPVLTVMLAGED